MIFQFLRFSGRPVWEATPATADRFLVNQRKELGLARTTVMRKAQTLAQFFDFLVFRYQGDVHAVTGHVLVQPIDEYNRPANAAAQVIRVPPREDEIGQLFSAWRESLPQSRKFLPAVRDYMAASLWRRVGLRISETVNLDIRDWRPDLGELGKLHVRFGKGSRGKGPKTRMVPAIDAVDALRHFCASSLYVRGMDLKAIQELLGHSWLSTTTRYIHVHDNHIENAWAQANERVAARLAPGER